MNAATFAAQLASNLQKTDASCTVLCDSGEQAEMLIKLFVDELIEAGIIVSWMNRWVEFNDSSVRFLDASLLSFATRDQLCTERPNYYRFTNEYI